VTGRAALLAIGMVLAAGAASAEGPTIANGIAVLQGLDKVTARISPVEAPLDQPTRFGNLEIIARTCLETPPTEPPESAAFLEIYELPPASEPDAPPAELFSGWMFASSPAVSALEHPVYDVWVVDCEAPIELPNDDQAGAETMRPPSE
jgi:hypothetical protein